MRKLHLINKRLSKSLDVVNYELKWSNVAAHPESHLSEIWWSDSFTFTAGMGVNLWGESPLYVKRVSPWDGCYQKYEQKARTHP